MGPVLFMRYLATSFRTVVHWLSFERKLLIYIFFFFFMFNCREFAGIRWNPLESARIESGGHLAYKQQIICDGLVAPLPAALVGPFSLHTCIL